MKNCQREPQSRWNIRSFTWSLWMRPQVFFVIINLFIGGVSTAYGSIPPSQFIVKTWVNKHKGIHSVRIKSLVTLYDQGKPSSFRFKEVMHYNADRQVLHSWVLNESDQKLFGRIKTGSSHSLVTSLLFSSDFPEIARQLKQKEIPIKTDEDLANLKTIEERVAAENELLKRWNGTPAWVIGDLKGPQIWFEKDAFTLVRLIASLTKQAQVFDLRFENYPNPHTHKISLPRLISVADESGKVLLSAQVSDFDVNPSSSNQELVDRRSDNQFTEIGAQLSEEVRNLIRLYYDTVR